MEVISSKSFEEDSSDDEDSNQNENYNYNSEPFCDNYSQNKLDYNNISEDEEYDNNENNDNEVEMDRINEINELDEDSEETEGNMNNNIEKHYDDNEISNSVQNIENNTINTIDEENDEYNENSCISNNNNKDNKSNNICGDICNNINHIENILNYPNIHMLFDNMVNKQIPLVFYDGEKFAISQEAKELFNKIGDHKIGIISLLGEYHSKEDKYFFLNKILSNNSKIELLDNQQNNNNIKGILVYSKPLIIKNNFVDEEFPCFIIDTINIDINITNDEINDESKIFLIIILISCLFIFSSTNINEKSLNYMNLILILMKAIKLRSALEGENESEITEFLPTLLWILQNSNLQLEDKDGNTITEKEYMEKALEIVNGTTDLIEENNRIKTILKNYFPKRDCFIMMNSSDLSLDEKNINGNNISKKMMKYEEQINLLKNKIIKKVKPKMFYNHYLNGNLLIELIESLLNNINVGGVPIMENLWKYIMKSECIKTAKELINNFNNELREYRNDNINKKIFFNDNLNEKYKNEIIEKYMKEFTNSKKLDEETKIEYMNKIKNKLELEFKKYEKENEKFFEEQFIKDLNLLSNKFMENFTSDIYEKNSYQFFQDFENFRETAVQASPDFPQKNEILFDKVLLIIKKFINGKIMKIKVINEEKNYLENENKKQEQKLNELNNELFVIKDKNDEFIMKLNCDIQMEKKKYKRIEDKINGLINNKTKEIENLNKEIEIETNNYEKKIKEIIETNNNLDKEIKIKDEQLLVMKKNNEKISSLHNQKTKYLEREINSWKDKYSIIIKESLLKENELNKENLKLKEKNKFLMKKEKYKKEEINLNRNYNNNININKVIKYNNNNNNTNQKMNNNYTNGIDNTNNGNENINYNMSNSVNNKLIKNNNNLNGLMTYIKMNLKDSKNKMLKLDKFFLSRKKQKEENKEIKEQQYPINNDNIILIENEKINDSNPRENSSNGHKVYIRNLSKCEKKENTKKAKDGQNTNYIQYKDLANNNANNNFKCKFCLKTFNFQQFKEHYNLCAKNPMNVNSVNNSHIHDNNIKEKSGYKIKVNSNINTAFTSDKINNSHLDNDSNTDNTIAHKNTIKKFTLSNSSINANVNNNNNNNNNSNLRSSNSKNITNNNGNSNNNSNRVSLTSNKALNQRNKKDNNNNILTNTNTSITINNNSENASTFNNVTNDNNNILIKAGNNKNNNIYDNNNNGNNNNKKISNNNFIPQKLKIKIIKGRIRKDKSGKPYLEYIININYNNTINWNIIRRFNQFTNLYKTLRTLSKDNFELPESSNIFNNITALFSGLSHEEKIFQLEKFLKDLTNTEGIFNSKYLFWFLELNHIINDNDNNTNTNDGKNNNHQRNNTDLSKNKKNNVINTNSK